MALVRPVVPLASLVAIVLAQGCAAHDAVPPSAAATGDPSGAGPNASIAPSAAAHAAEPLPVLADAPTWEAWRRADTLVLTPRRSTGALAPLVRHRSAQGHVVAELEIEPRFERFTHGQPDGRALQKAVRSLAAHTAERGGALRYVLLAGDFDELPTFYLRKGAYEHHDAREHDNPHAISRAEHVAYPSDDPYAVTTESLAPSAPRAAVGRIPARAPEEIDAFVRKLVAYESAPLAATDQSWRRRVTLYAGDPYFGEMGDELVRTVAEGILDQDMSYDYDLRLTFAKETSPYAYGFDRIERKFVGDMDDGALVAAYVGHGAVTRFAPASFRGRRYEVGTADDATALRIASGKPVFFSIACDTGAFDRPGGLPSLAERMILNPDGPVAVFASSRESHPYPNALYGLEIIRHFVNERPATVGDGVLAIKDGMVRGSMPVAELLLGDDIDALKAEHVGLYNLFGDPATKLRYAAPLTVTFAVMARNNAAANDKVVAFADGVLHAGRAAVTLRAPDAGDYVVKAFASGSDAALGHAMLHVTSSP
jgi:hypothetical protein